MFEKLMSLVKRGGTLTVAQVARELDTTPEVARGAIDHLTRTGWLRPLKASCDTGCNQCVFAGQCQPRGQGRVWQMQQESFVVGANKVQ